MDKMTFLGLLGQAENDDISESFKFFIRGAARFAVMDVISEELQRLCGQALAVNNNTYFYTYDDIAIRLHHGYV
jgi:hypothetical protein